MKRISEIINKILVSLKSKEIASYQDYDEYNKGRDSQIIVYENDTEYLISVRGEWGDEYTIKSYDKNKTPVDTVLNTAKRIAKEDKFRTEPEFFTRKD